MRRTRRPLRLARDSHNSEVMSTRMSHAPTAHVTTERAPADTRDEARRHPRVVVTVPAILDASNSDASIDVVLVDVGKGGVLVEPKNVEWDEAALPPVGARSTLTFRMIGNRMCEATGRVVRHHERGFAIAFQELNRAMESFLRHLAKLPTALRRIYIIDVHEPHLALDIPA